MPYVNIKVTGGAEAPTAKQKAELIEGVTHLLQKVLNKNPETTVVVIDEVDMDNWGDWRENGNFSTFNEVIMP